jgi:hypothetical protein
VTRTRLLFEGVVVLTIVALFLFGAAHSLGAL